jgi:hypothetical protein
MRMLFEHMMDALAPIADVARCSWYKVETQNGKPSRKQRVMFAIQGGLSPTFVRKTLKIDAAPFQKRLVAAVDDLSRQVHGREVTLVVEASDQDAFIGTTIGAVTEFLVAIRDCRSAILDPIAEALDDEAVNALVSETLAEVDELATHHSIEDIDLENTQVHSIGPETITYRAIGTISVGLQWGSNADVRNGDGAELDESFPFHVDFELPLHELWDISYAETNYCVDTSSWCADDEEC